ncbi:MAG: class I SAM-dependent DNA methyltransferase, partial [Anaerolineae bacterium]
EVIRLMVRLLLAGDPDKLAKPGIILKVYDPCAGSGGMLTAAKDEITALNPEAEVLLYGQEVNPETYAVCKADMLMKSPDGRDAENIKFGSTLSDDRLSHERFDYLLSNPPYGKDWRRDKGAVEKEARRGGRFSAGTPRISDGQLLFLQHMLSRMNPPAQDGGRVAIVMNGSPLFTGDAGSGESQIRRWILENDWLECIVALPDQLFYNTGINTYVWVLSNRKEPRRQGKVQLIDATDFYRKMRKSLGDKRHELGEEHIRTIVDLYTACEEGEHSRIFDREEFGYRKIRVERPLRLNFQATPARIERLKEQRAFQNLARSRRRDPEKRAQEEAEGREQQQAILNMLAGMLPTLYKDKAEFRQVLKRAARQHGITLHASMRKAIYAALGEKDEMAEVARDGKGRPEPDTDRRDYENVPLKKDIWEYFEREVRPYVPDAWVDEDYRDEKDGQVGRVGYEINFNRHFYQYQPPRPLEEIEADIAALEREILAMLGEVAG